MARGEKKAKEQKPIEQTIWDAANKLRGKVEPAEYKHVVLSMIFLKYANDRFNDHREQMIAAGQQAFLEMMPFYTKDNVFYIPECARWAFIMENAKQPDIAIKIDTALHEIEMKNPTLEGALPDNYYSRLHMDPSGLSSLLDLINGIDLQVGGAVPVEGAPQAAAPGGSEAVAGHHRGRRDLRFNIRRGLREQHARASPSPHPPPRRAPPQRDDAPGGRSARNVGSRIRSGRG